MNKCEAEIRAQSELVEARACVNRARIEKDLAVRDVHYAKAESHLRTVSTLLITNGLLPRDIGSRYRELKNLAIEAMGTEASSSLFPIRKIVKA